MLGPDEDVFEEDTNDDKPNDRSIYLIDKVNKYKLLYIKYNIYINII